MPKNQLTPKNSATGTIRAKAEKEPEPETTPPGPVVQGKQGCTPSFLNQKNNEMDEVCELTPQQKKEEYVQPESEKESGGES
jgi:hypothetical protein